MMLIRILFIWMNTVIKFVYIKYLFDIFPIQNGLKHGNVLSPILLIIFFRSKFLLHVCACECVVSNNVLHY
jgi:hypothetical protein